MRFKHLSRLNRPEPLIIELESLPQHISMTTYAKDKAFKINELVASIFKESFEWYGFTMATNDRPELIVDIGLPANNFNLQDYTALGPERIAEFQETLAKDLMINGWIHSHGALNYRHFSDTDEKNHLTVLEFIAARTRKTVAKKEIIIQDLIILEKNHFTTQDLAKGSVSLITDGPVSEAKIMETVYGSFCYSIVIGDEGWYRQSIHFQQRGVLSGHRTIASKTADIEFIDSGKILSRDDVHALRDEVRKKIKPHTDPPPETIERM